MLRTPASQPSPPGRSTHFSAPLRKVTANPANGLKLRALKEPAFFMYPTGFVDRFSAFDVKSFVTKVDQVVAGLPETAR